MKEMKKSSIIAACICLAGLLLIGIGISLTRTDAKRAYEKGYNMRTEKNYTCTGEIKELSVNETSVKTVISRGDVKTPEIRYYVNEKTEEVIIAEKNGKQYLVQVAYSIAEESTYQREFALFDKLDQSRKKIIITMDEADFSTSTVEHIPVSRFLLSDQLS